MEILIMFLTSDELKNNLYGHVIDNITQSDATIAEQAVAAAVSEMKSYLAAYDTAAIFSAAGADRNALILENTKVIAVWNILKLSNAETLYDVWRERYDRVIQFMTKVADGAVTPDLPARRGGDGEIATRMRMGSNTKFNHNV